MYGRINPNANMMIKISNERRLSGLQADFNALFPFLKIEFFKTPHKIGEALAKNLIHVNSRFVRDCRVSKTEGDLIINEQMTVNELEEQFLSKFGLSAQVFRKSGNVWLETSATDSWSLRQQNDEGAELSRQINPRRENPEDSDIY
jgi:hypothetical protein